VRNAKEVLAQETLARSQGNGLARARRNELVCARHNKRAEAQKTMATPSERLAASLEVLRELQQNGQHVFQAGQLSRVHRDRLVKNGFLQPVVKGWLMSTSPGARPGDSTAWFASFWEFCAAYCNERFGTDWHLSPEQSLLLHAENTVVPAQATVYSRKGHNNTIALPFRTALYDLKQAKMPPQSQLARRDALRLFTPEAALARVPESFFRHHSLETQVVLARITDASNLLRILLDGGHSSVAGRLAGALRRAGSAEQADEILSTMKRAGYDVRESDPYANGQTIFAVNRPTEAPIVSRIQALWTSTRGAVLDIFPPPPGLPAMAEAYLAHVDDIYKEDAYHSLSIEGYRVNPVLIERVISGQWDPKHNEADKHNRDALAARGYWQAFQDVKASVLNSPWCK